jgi:hypothetical protein
MKPLTISKMNSANVQAHQDHPRLFVRGGVKTTAFDHLAGFLRAAGSA